MNRVVVIKYLLQQHSWCSQLHCTQLLALLGAQSLLGMLGHSPRQYTARTQVPSHNTGKCFSSECSVCVCNEARSACFQQQHHTVEHCLEWLSSIQNNAVILGTMTVTTAVATHQPTKEPASSIA
eukprot:10413-Heterococcus_DN1.PRE.4